MKNWINTRYNEYRVLIGNNGFVVSASIHDTFVVFDLQVFVPEYDDYYTINKGVYNYSSCDLTKEKIENSEVFLLELIEPHIVKMIEEHIKSLQLGLEMINK